MFLVVLNECSYVGNMLQGVFSRVAGFISDMFLVFSMFSVLQQYGVWKHGLTVYGRIPVLFKDYLLSGLLNNNAFQ